MRPTSALIVDDEPHVRTYLRLLLTELGISTVWEATDGGQALTLAQQHQPGIVLLDINLPVVSGLDVLAQLQEAAPEIPVVIVTSRTALQTVLDAERLGAVAYLLKHAPRTEALASLRATLDGLAEEDEDTESEGNSRPAGS